MNTRSHPPHMRPPKAETPTIDESLTLIFERLNMTLTMQQIADVLNNEELAEAINNSPEMCQFVKKVTERALRVAVEKELVFERLPIDPSLY